MVDHNIPFLTIKKTKKKYGALMKVKLSYCWFVQKYLFEQKDKLKYHRNNINSKINIEN